MNDYINYIKGVFLVALGGNGVAIAQVQPWQQHLEWGARMTLTILSIVSVAVGLYVALRPKKK